jgi:hypothetical protein
MFLLRLLACTRPGAAVSHSRLGYATCASDNVYQRFEVESASGPVQLGLVMPLVRRHGLIAAHASKYALPRTGRTNHEHCTV